MGYAWTFIYEDDFWMNVHILEPHQTTYGPFNFSIIGP